MDPNSEHQLWSRWDVTIDPPRKAGKPFTEARDAWAKFCRKQFGAAGEVRLEERVTARRSPLVRMVPVMLGDERLWFAQARIEGVPAHDPAYRKHAMARIARFWTSGLGPGTHVHIDVKIEAGDQQDGRPRSQLVVLPTIHDAAGPGAFRGESALSQVQAAAPQQAAGPRH